MMGFALAITALFTVLGRPLQQPDDRAEVARVVQSFFDAMKQQDTTALRATMLPEARLVNPIRRADRSINVRVLSGDQLVTMVAATAEPFDERMPKSEIRIDTDMATVWGWYTFRVGTRITNCGMNSFQLLRTDAGWKISHIGSTIETQDCAVREES
jgi:hypothetical protein